MVEVNVRYVKQNALAGRDDELTCWEDYQKLASYWRDEVANVRIHETTQQRPVDRFRDEQSLLRALPRVPYATDEIVSAVVNSHARIRFDSNPYSVPPTLARKTVVGQALATQRCASCGLRRWNRRHSTSSPYVNLANLSHDSRFASSYLLP